MPLRPSLALLLWFPLASLAQDVADDEPAVAAASGLEHGKAATADASPVDPGAVEVEVGFAPAFNDRRGIAGFQPSSAGNVQALTGTITYGVYRDVDVKLSAGYARIYDAAHQHADGSAPKHGAGMSDAVAGARWRFLNLPERSLELAVTSELVLPLGTDHTPTAIGTTQGFWGARGALVATKDLGSVTTNTELALSAPVSGDAGGLRSVAQANVAVGWQLHRVLQPELELNYSYTSSLDSDAQVLAVTAGVVAPFGAGQRIVAAVQQGVWGRHSPQTTSAVVAYKTGF